ncbi:MAG: hypothetical protein LBH01_06510 [Verrucomicrobiales bacterium]|jgi:hypothetical protein|nr:hypothetical protein [Verrucomicrobiales bacterium]
MNDEVVNTSSNRWVSLAGILGFIVAWVVCDFCRIHDSAWLVILFLGCVAGLMLLIGVCKYRNQYSSSNGLISAKSPYNRSRVSLKILGIVSTIVIIAFFYWLFPEYSKAIYYPVWHAFYYASVPLILLGVAYVIWVDCHMIEPEDAYYHTGLLVLGRWENLNWSLLKSHALGWLMKGFFLPFMLSSCAYRLANFNTYQLNFHSFGHLYFTLFNVLLTVDLVFGSIGYLLTLRITDSHIRSVDATWLGWFSALICYTPFSKITWGSYLKYEGPIQWTDWLEPYPVIFITWGFIILLLYAIYVWATISFGCRFSNLTHRGIITHGPYRYLKHPAYVSKCMAWWMVFIPFIAYDSWQGNLRACICLLLTCGLYILRAWTEERHLMKDPAYQKYAEWISKNGLFAPLSRQINLIVSKAVGKLTHEH